MIPPSDGANATITYDKEGRWLLTVTPSLLGNYTVRVTLDGKPLTKTLLVVAVCPVEKSPSGDSPRTCGCKPGFDWESGKCKMCPKGFYSPNTNSRCLPCMDPHAVSAEGAMAQSDCVCKNGYYNNTGSTKQQCYPCPPHTECYGASGNATANQKNVTLATIDLSPGFWRLSHLTNQINDCGGDACLGGPEPGDNSCAYGTKGPLCRVCALPWHYPRESGSSKGCHKCPEHGALAIGNTILHILVGATAVLLVAGVVWRSYHRMDQSDSESSGTQLIRLAACCTSCITAARQVIETHGLVGKLKIVVTYFQIMMAMPEVPPSPSH